MRSWPLLLFSVLAVAASAQSNSVKGGTGTVTGHVYCADTNAPARMAQIQLETVKEAQERLASHGQASPGLPAGGIVQTALDGSFVIPDVAPGSYYVVASSAGYLSSRADANDTDDTEPPAPADQPPVIVPKVDVQADQTVAVDIRLERGAAVSGTIRFDDGSPATGIHVAAVHKSKDGSMSSNSANIGIAGNEVTDDLGHYRVSGLRDGEYVVEALLSHLDFRPAAKNGEGLSATMRSTLMIYSGDATRKSNAISFKLGPGEERTGENISIPLGKLHSISGVVTAARDGHPINAASLRMTAPNDDQIIVTADIDADGSFHMESVPEGTYILRVRDARDQQMQILTGPGNMSFSSEKTLHQYGDLEQSIKVEGDIPNLVLAVPERTKNAAGSP